MAKAIESGDSEPAAKRAKTGGRPAKQTLDQKIEDAIKRGKLAALPDDTTVDSELAAFYLMTSMSQLREHRKDQLPSEEDKKAARLEKLADAAAKAAGRTRKKPVEEEAPKKGLRMIKLAEKGAIGSNQPVTYKMGDLRKFQDECSGYTTFDTLLASSGIVGFATHSVPFFAAPKPDRKGRPVLQCKGWGLDLPKREKLLVRAVSGEIRCVWLTPSEALQSLWTSESEHRKFSKPWVALLKQEIGAAKAAIDRTAINAIAFEGTDAKGKKGLR